MPQASDELRAEWCRARGDMNAKMSGLGSTHLQAHDPRVKEFHAFLNSMQGVPA